MTHDDWDDEAWADDDGELDDDEAARCPECGGPIHIITDKCPECGYWLSEADRHSMWSGMSKPRWLRVTAAIVLVAFLLSLLAIGAALF
jgi:hypothetical protein